MTMSTNQSDETPDNITTDAESQEYGAQHGQNVEGQDTGSSAPDASAPQEGAGDAETGEGMGAHT
jgi:hypothetical protein